ncbi:MAG: hypothetical protein ACE3JK_02160 [Sporolactobacillus sp.]
MSDKYVLMLDKFTFMSDISLMISSIGKKAVKLYLLSKTLYSLIR